MKQKKPNLGLLLQYFAASICFLYYICNSAPRNKKKTFILTQNDFAGIRQGRVIRFCSGAASLRCVFMLVFSFKLWRVIEAVRASFIVLLCI